MYDNVSRVRIYENETLRSSTQSNIIIIIIGCLCVRRDVYVYDIYEKKNKRIRRK